ncbi:TRAP transporter small permease [Marasmitruncus massiliensis]|uniref:TRAP transporter small permease n=1 Tax=Marasmitruncus massiliensis TaxID=1944642 RepID=UPI000C7BA7F8|nr:TRAP transporter small permease [Marasmitruncus massiliensis]MBE6906860.1 TRAP transporter small permease [Oscillospiraceae bacterium]
MPGKKLLQRLLNVDVLLAGVCLIILVSITFVGVIMRYFFSNPFVWQEEIQLWLFLWIAFFGGSAAFREKSHVEIDVIVELLPQKIQKVIQILIYALVVIVLGYLCLKGMMMIQQFIATNKSTFVLSVPSSLIYSVVPVGCVLMIINYTIVEWRDLFKRQTDAGEDEQ